MEFQRALVTGATSGIGEALCRFLAAKGINLIISGRDQQKLESLCIEFKSSVEVEAIKCDLAKQDDLDRLLKLIEVKSPDLVVNNAGFGIYGNALDSPVQEQIDIADVNGRAPLMITLVTAKTLKEQSKKGVILNVASVAAFQPCPSLTVYAASKAFLTFFSESLDLELEEYGIRVLAACPGQVSTSFQNRAARKPLRRRGEWICMTSEFAAEEIWKQIQKGTRVYIFDWHYRCIRFLTHYLLPRRFVGKLVEKSIDKLRNEKK